MNTTFILRNKQFNKLSNEEKENVILQVKQTYINEGLQKYMIVNKKYLNTIIEFNFYYIY